MDKSDPDLKPEWLKSSNGGTSSSAISIHHNEHHIGGSSRNKLSPANERDRSLFSSSRKSLSSNGSRKYDKDVSGKSYAYSSFGRRSRGRERDKEKNYDSLDRVSSSGFADNGFRVRFDSLTSRPEKDSLSRSSSMVSGRPVDIWSEGLGNNEINGISHRGSVTAGTFEKDFPSLGAEEKSGRVEAGRVSSPGFSSLIQSKLIGSASITGVDGWNSVLAEVPALVGTNGLSASSMPQSVHTSQALVAPSSMTGLNMAETVAQAPSRAHTPPELSIDMQRIDELTLRQCKQLIPVTPSATKCSVSSSSDKLRNKGGARVGDSGAVPKGGLQLPSLAVNAPARAAIRTDITKPSQLGTLQVLNRERNNGISSSGKEVQNTSKAMSPVGLAAKSPKSAPLSSPRGSILEKRVNPQAKDRNEFFNFLRKKSSNNSSAVPEPGCPLPPSIMSSGGDHGSDAVFSNRDLKPYEYGASVTEDDADGCQESKMDIRDNGEMNVSSEAVDPEEEAFLRLLGWDRHAEVDALTAEEIEAFYVKHKERMKSSRD